jgi:hypothetical protein
MPKRSNLFQDVVGIIHMHMADGATVEESAMLVNRVSGRKREVDVVMTNEAATHPVTVSVEASSARRPATVEWVERMIGKHADLPTDKLVLVAENGFREQAREYAESKGVLTIAPEDLAEGEPAYRIVNRLQSIWPKTITLQPPKEVRVTVSRASRGDRVWFKSQPDHIVYLQDGEELGTLLELVEALVSATRERAMDHVKPELASISEDATRDYVLVLGADFFRIEEEQLCVRDHTVTPPELQPTEQLIIIGDALIHVSELSLSHRRLGDVSYAYAEGTVGGREALFVVTEGEKGGTATIRFRPQKEE